MSAEQEKINPEKVLEDAREKMKKAVEVFASEIASIRTGRATPALVEDIKVFVYESEMPLKHIASISVESPSTLVIEPYDKGTISAIEKAILQSGRDLTPSNDGNVIRIKLPPLTQERRQELVKIVRKKAEEFKVSIRNIRAGARDKIREAKDQKAISEDMMRKYFDKIQKLTDEFIGQIEKIAKRKEEEILG